MMYGVFICFIEMGIIVLLIIVLFDEKKILKLEKLYKGEIYRILKVFKIYIGMIKLINEY